MMKLNFFYNWWSVLWMIVNSTELVVKQVDSPFFYYILLRSIAASIYSDLTPMTHKTPIKSSIAKSLWLAINIMLSSRVMLYPLTLDSTPLDRSSTTNAHRNRLVRIWHVTRFHIFIDLLLYHDFVLLAVLVIWYCLDVLFCKCRSA